MPIVLIAAGRDSSEVEFSALIEDDTLNIESEVSVEHPCYNSHCGHSKLKNENWRGLKCIRI